jgi:hypothetical protein
MLARFLSGVAASPAPLVGHVLTNWRSSGPLGYGREYGYGYGYGNGDGNDRRRAALGVVKVGRRRAKVPD